MPRQEAERWVPYTGFPLMGNAARCYRSAGLEADARRAEKEAARLKALR
ncbi:MAG: hypothetical protein M9921_12250 [Fimbriimonadaceae bacterium]|nr:hypothetical protein [Chthonomonadaceae bacterium]MCO5297618.1 hypothetical protein [Fimbriimonadaceae bacterium]